MQVGKVYFIHLREPQENGQYVNNSGATLAWYVDAEGRLYVGKPAVCHPADVFRKDKGREVAEQKLDNEDAFFVIQPEQIKGLAAAQSVGSMNFATLTPATRLDLFEIMTQSIQENVVNIMTTSWFEGLVRDRLQLVKGRVKCNHDAVSVQEAMTIIGGGMLLMEVEQQAGMVIDI